MLCATSSSHPPTPLPVKRPCWPIFVKALSKVILAQLAADVAVGTVVRKSPLNRALCRRPLKVCAIFVYDIFRCQTGNIIFKLLRKISVFIFL